jgi:GntR family transcriptional repressor for pyruvate dehydrogenase complex
MSMEIMFKPVRTEKISSLIVEQIKSAIHAGSMKPGDKLPSEREFAEVFKASRVSIREALKRLETFGLLTVKVGRGVFVAQMDATHMSESLSALLRMRNGTLDDLTEGRLIFEPSIARLAAERITPEEILVLEDNVAAVEAGIRAGVSVYEKNIEFHSLIAQATHNLSIGLTMQSMLKVVGDTAFRTAEQSTVQRVNEFAGQAARVHKEIVRSFKEKNPQQACKSMEKDILLVQKWLKELKRRASALKHEQLRHSLSQKKEVIV